MRISFITLFAPPDRNAGTENYTHGVARGLADRGHDVEIVCAGTWDDGARYFNGVDDATVDGVRVVRLNLNWLRAQDPNRVLFDSPVVEQWFAAYLTTRMPDVVHATSALTLGVGPLRASHRRKIPLVLTLMDFWFLCPRTILMTGEGALCDGHTTAWDCQRCLMTSSGLFQRTAAFLSEDGQRRLWTGISRTPFLSRQRGARGMALDMEARKTLMRQALEWPDVVLSHSRFVQRTFASSGCRSVRYLPNGHDLAWLSGYQGKSRSDVTRIGYLGQIADNKGIHTLVEAFRRANLGNRARLDIWGDETRDTVYTNRIRSLMGEAPAMALRGRYERSRLGAVLQDIDVLVVPSTWYENAPLVIQEAFAAGTPVIATNLGGMAEAITHEVNGLLFERNDVVDLARQLRRVVDDPQLLPALRAALPTVRTISEELDELERIYGSLRAERSDRQGAGSSGTARLS